MLFYFFIFIFFGSTLSSQCSSVFLFCRNYVVQFILELRIPSATSTLTSQFEGNYVHLSTQKFSSHVVEKCLDVLNYESRSRIIRELLSVSHFEQLLQDPHANYVVQTALRISEVWESTPCKYIFLFFNFFWQVLLWFRSPSPANT